jgi:hypothetical protein
MDRSPIGPAEVPAGLPPRPHDGSPLPEYYIDLYKFAVELADRVSARRATANSFFLTLNAGLAAFLGIAAPPMARVAPAQEADPFASILLAVVGSILALAWWLLLRSYRDLSRAKFDVVLALEQRLEVMLLSDEWTSLTSGPIRPWWRRYVQLGSLERVIPALFFCLYVLTGVLAVLA